MELPVIYYDPKEVIETSQQNKVHKECKVHGSQNIVVNGNGILFKDVIIRGDMAKIKMGKYTIIRERTVIRPAYKIFHNGATYIHSQIGEHVMIEEDCVIEAVQIGSFVHIGAGSILGSGVIVKDCSIILPGSVVPPNQIIPPFSVFGGNPAIQLDDAPESTNTLMKEATEDFFNNYRPATTTT